MNREGLVRIVLAAKFEAMPRRVLCACICLADEDGYVNAEPSLIGPMAGVRFHRMAGVFQLLEAEGWLVMDEGEGLYRLSGPLNRQRPCQ